MEGKDLRKAGLKVTLPRLKILEILERSTTRHLSAEDIYRSLLESNEDIGLATVYRVLTQFEAASLVTRHHFEDGMAVFELNEGTHHDHIVCLDCGRVEEFTEEGIEARQTAVRLAGPEGIDRLLAEHRLDALLAPTNGPASRIDFATGDHTNGRSSGFPAICGYPHLTVPMGQVQGLPVGLSFIGPPWSEALLLALGYAFEQAAQARKPPAYIPSLETTAEAALASAPSR